MSYDEALEPVRVTPPAPLASPPQEGVARLRAMIERGACARATKSLLVYVHVPFCSSKCHFCDWVVGYEKADLLDTGDLRSRYVDALCLQIRQVAPLLQDLGYHVTNLYWGGGTPTRLTPSQMARIHDELAQGFDLSGLQEYTAECSPETVTAEHLDALVSRGLNRASTGAQSFDADILRRMGRAHSSTQIHRTIDAFRSAGLTNFNLDLITGFNQQAEESVLDSIEQAIAAGVPHLSLYMFRDFSTGLVAVRQLSSGRQNLSTPEERSKTYMAAKARLEAAGYEEYVVGYFALAPAFRFDSEDYYFGLRGDYVGFGAGAASVLGRHAIKFGNGDRYGGVDIRHYIADPLSLSAGPVARMPDALFTDGYFKAFATRDGIHFARWRDQFGFDFRELREARAGIRTWFAEHERQGAVFIEDADGIRLSEQSRVPTMIWRR